MIRIVVVDDHPVVRDGVASMLGAVEGFEVVGTADSGPAGVELAAAHDPDVVLMDLRMPGGSGLDAVRELQRRSVRAGVLVLTTYDTDSDTVAAIEAGATGYLLKDAPTQQLIDAVRATAVGETFLSPAVATRLATHLRSPRSTAVLSARELEVLRLVAQGTTNKEIARALFVSEATVKTHLIHVYEKLDANDRAQAVATAYERGILGR